MVQNRFANSNVEIISNQIKKFPAYVKERGSKYIDRSWMKKLMKKILFYFYQHCCDPSRGTEKRECNWKYRSNKKIYEIHQKTDDGDDDYDDEYYYLHKYHEQVLTILIDDIKSIV